MIRLLFVRLFAAVTSCKEEEITGDLSARVIITHLLIGFSDKSDRVI